MQVSCWRREFRLVKRLITIVTTGALLTACAGAGGGSVPSLQTPPDTTTLANKHTGTVVIRITIPKRKHHRHRVGAKYLSPSTQAMIILIGGPKTRHQTIGLTPNSPGCSAGASGTVCTTAIALKACPSTANCYSGTIATYDKVLCAGLTCVVPPGAEELSANQDIAFSIAVGKTNTIPITLDGIPTSVLFAPLPPSTLSGSVSGGFTLSKCVTTRQSVSVVGVDADGNRILGPGAPVPALSSNDATHLKAIAPAPASPNTFELAPPAALASATIPNAGSAVQLTAGVTPLAGSGGSAQSLPINVTFNHDICGVITETSIPTSGSQPFGITSGSDGALWFTESLGNNIGRITTGGTITETSIPTVGSEPSNITPGPDGALWFTESGGNKIGRITTGGTITETPVTTGASLPFGITSGPDRALWFAEYTGNNIGRITTGGTITETALPTSGSQPYGITSGPDGELWFTEINGNKIGRITTGGTITETSIQTGSSYPSAITSGPDGALWFTETTATRSGASRPMERLPKRRVQRPRANRMASRLVRTGRCGLRNVSAARSAHYDRWNDYRTVDSNQRRPAACHHIWSGWRAVVYGAQW